MFKRGDVIEGSLSDVAVAVYVLGSGDRMALIKEPGRPHKALDTLYDLLALGRRGGGWVVRRVLASELEWSAAEALYIEWASQVAPGDVMSHDRRVVIAQLANAAKVTGAPRLEPNSPRQTILDWLQQNDRNGTYFDWLQDDPADRISLESAWELLADVFSDELQEIHNRLRYKVPGSGAPSELRVRPQRTAMYPSLDVQVVRTMYGTQGWDLRLTWRVPDRQTDTSNWGGDFTRTRAFEVGADIARKQSIARLDPRNPNPVRVLDEQGRCVAQFHAGRPVPCSEGIIRRLRGR
jgi:hypothetical protein